MSFLKQLRANSTLKAPIFLPSLFLITFITLYCIFFPQYAQTTLNFAKQQIFTHFSWFYVLAASIFILFLVLLCSSRLGDVRLGADNEEPEYPFLSWVAMLFAAGMGIGLMYFGVAEPMLHYVSPLSQGLTNTEKAKEAMLMTFYHWGIHAWAIYAVIGLTLAYFGFRYKLPLTIRSGFYPLLKHHISGFWGHVIDVCALCSTIFGITTTLGYGAMQLDAGLNSLGWIDSRSFSTLSILIIVVMCLATISAITGVAKGVRRLSEINLFLALSLLIFVMVMGPTLLLLTSFTENLGYYLSKLVSLSFRTFAYEPQNQGWFSGWTVLYWAWWVSWAPFVGLFIAKISKGRTIREFILGVLFIPSLFNALWMTVFGNSAIWLDGETAGNLTALSVNTEALLFGFFEQLPLGNVASFIAIVIIALFFVTSADSGIYVINSIASQGEEKSVKWQSVFWAVLLAVLAISLLRSDGLSALQTMTLVIALPFTLIMLLLCFGLWKGLMVDNQYFSKTFSQGSGNWSGKHWKSRLEKILSQSKRADVRGFLDDIAQPAFNELVIEFEKYGLTAKVEMIAGKNPKVEFIVMKENLRNFLYGIECKSRELSALVVEDDSMPNIDSERIYEPITYFIDGREGYDVQYMTKDELIADVLKQYERYINLAMDNTNALMTFDVA
ncbi:BCCT family transporter [Pasteurella dagmatis]|uniref:Transporter, betaine/carnitine/choline family n=1 Tax=Pasteurella dagmatis ATCC 43325 TaxID=667128 RepID=C9PSE6_9PAST|nr:BCCT family transporter [Pasteurella dagmatis]EEX49565.1 transporter, betaine/carnitine/choline family [Pasteurella dagmatis ATCC 43325]SNV83231.1 putative transporter [Pasteurella dagmatis]